MNKNRGRTYSPRLKGTDYVDQENFNNYTAIMYPSKQSIHHCCTENYTPPALVIKALTI